MFTLDEVKIINDYVQDSFFRFYSMYHYALTKDQLITLSTEAQLELDEPRQASLSEGKVIAAREVEADIKQFLSAEEKAQIDRENEYMLRGPGRIEKIMRDEMDKLTAHMEDRIRAQDEDFINKMQKK